MITDVTITDHNGNEIHHDDTITDCRMDPWVFKGISRRQGAWRVLVTDLLADGEIEYDATIFDLTITTTRR